MKKLIAILLSTAMLCMACSGCGKESKRITLWLRDDRNGHNQSLQYVQAISAFRDNNKGSSVQEVDVSDMTEEEYETKLRTELMAGKGPDVILGDRWLFGDVYKTMASGAFCDLNEFLQADEEYHPEDYYQDVIKAGQYQSKQYIMPTTFEPSYVLTSKSSIEKSGVDLENCKTFTGYVNELNKFLDTSDGEQKISKTSFEPHGFYQYISGLLDYENRIVHLDTPEFRKIIEDYKKIYQATPSPPEYGNYYEYGYNHLIENESIFVDTYSLFDLASRILTYDEPIIVPKYTTEGKIKASIENYAAIPKGSKNKQLAYNFIKELMSENIQNNERGNFSFYPVLKSSMKPLIEREKEVVRRLVDKENERAAKFDFTLLPESFYQGYLEMLDQPMSVSMGSSGLSLVQKYIEPYFEDEKSLEACLKQGQDQLEIYISE